jgi:hypothetical protein
VMARRICTICMFKCSKESKRMGSTGLELDMFYSAVNLVFTAPTSGFEP